jgi:methylenetetrahydrofolate dehydrogenase (NADP+)/methenyltetrahydrofolate cyclohydrolase
LAAQRIDGKKIAQDLREALRLRVEALGTAYQPGLSVILVGEDPASQIYVRNKAKASEELGIASFVEQVPSSISQEALLAMVEERNQDPKIHGILVQMPLPKSIDPVAVVHAIRPDKDVDGFHPENVGALASGNEPAFLPCTPAGILRLLDSAQVPLQGARALVVGRSATVGRPVSLMLLGRDATVTIAHSHSRDLPSLVAEAEVLVAAVGAPELIRGEWIREGAAVIDVGINRLASGKLCGDVGFAEAEKRARVITPVPGGVGPMTIAMLLENTVIAAERCAARRA